MLREYHIATWIQRQGHFCQLTEGWFEVEEPEIPDTLVPIKRRPTRTTLYGSTSGQHFESNGFSPLGWEVENSKHLGEEKGTVHSIERVYPEGQRYRKASEGPKRTGDEKPRAPAKVPKQ